MGWRVNASCRGPQLQLRLSNPIQYTGCNDVTESMVTTRSPSCGYNTIYCVEINGEDLSCYSNKIVSLSLKKCPHDHWLTNKASYLSAITVTNISQSFTYKMAAKINWHRYGTKLRHCHPVYSSMHFYECVALCKDISLPRFRFCARSLASCIPRSGEDRSSWVFFIQVVRGCPGGRLQFSGGGSKMAWLASAFSPVRARCPMKVRRRDLTMDESVGWLVMRRMSAFLTKSCRQRMSRILRIGTSANISTVENEPSILSSTVSPPALNSSAGTSSGPVALRLAVWWMARATSERSGGGSCSQYSYSIPFPSSSQYKSSQLPFPPVCDLCNFSQIFASCWLDTLHMWVKLLSHWFDYLEQLPGISFWVCCF